MSCVCGHGIFDHDRWTGVDNGCGCGCSYYESDGIDMVATGFYGHPDNCVCMRCMAARSSV